MDKNKVASVAVVVAVLAVALFFLFGSDKADKLVNNVEGVATVNGVVISKSVYDTQLALLTSSLKTQGVDTENAEKLAQIKTQVLNDLINNELVNQGILSAGTKVSSEEVEKQLQDIVTQSGGVDNYKAELIKVNITEEQLRENISKQLTIQKYLASNVDTSGIVVSDTEISKFYADYSNTQKTASSTIKVPLLKDLSLQIKQQITIDKQQALVNAFLASLRAKAKITTSI